MRPSDSTRLRAGIFGGIAAWLVAWLVVIGTLGSQQEGPKGLEEVAVGLTDMTATSFRAQVPEPTPLPTPTPVPVVPSTPEPVVETSTKNVSWTVWDRLAECESNGNWSINTGNGYYGGLQFLPSTWRAAGGTKYAALPHQATREQQIAIAQSWLAKTSWAQWPACSRMLGLR